MTTSSHKTVIIAASVLSVLAFFQLIVVFVVLSRKPGSAPLIAASNPPTASSSDQPKAATSTQEKTASKPIPSSVPPTGETAIPEEAAPAGAPSEVDILVKRATDIRDKGDMSGTLASLRDAQNLFPDDPKIIAEFAKTYEQMGLVDKALAQWRRVMDAGDKAGDLYGIAAEKVRVGISPKEPISGRDEDGLQPGSTFGFVDVVKNYDTGTADAEKVSMRVGIKVRPGAEVLVPSFHMEVMFYDLVNNQEVAQHDPQTTKVTYDWLSLPVDWRGDGVEVLKVQYAQKPPPPGEKPATERKYLGYIIRIYYENELQDVIAEPVKLLQLFPPPVSLQKEIPQ
ncbi:MAG TPA: hypothetical protein VF585_11260 [Chthoniobacterales bacterium]